MASSSKFEEVKTADNSVDTAITTVEPDNSMEPLCKNFSMIKIPRDKIKFVIGKGGRVIKSIQSESGTKIYAEENGQIQITGYSENRKMAKKLIKSILRKSEQKTILIPQYVMGYLIGSQWKTINTIKEITGASVDKDVGTGTGSEVGLILRGTEKQIRRAEELILTVVSGAKEKDKVKREEAIESVDTSEINGDPKWQPPTSSTSTTASKPRALHPKRHDENANLSTEKKMAENKIGKKSVESVALKYEEKTLLISQYALWYLIGSEGKTINTIKEITGASVVIVNNRQDFFTGTEVRVILGGTEKQIRRAQELILTFVSQATEKGKVNLEEAIQSLETSENNGDPKCQPPTLSTSTPASKLRALNPERLDENVQLNSVKNLTENKNGKNSIKSISRKFERKTISIPQYTMGNLIGNKGKRINTIKERSGASVNTLDKLEDVGPGSGIRLILGGTKTQIKRAEELILTFVAQAEKNRKAKLEETIKLAEMSEIYGDPDWQPQPPSSSTSMSTAPTKTRKPKVTTHRKRHDENVKLNSEKTLVENKSGKKWKKKKKTVSGKEVFTNIPI